MVENDPPGRKILAAAILSIGVLAACAPDTRYRVLTFFFDGVPDPTAPEEEKPVKGGETGRGMGLAELSKKEGASRRPRTYFHPPYKDRKCASCHDMYRGELTRTVEEGLCLDCHQALREKDAYLHGPFAVNACLACHHPHASSFPGMLTAPVETICLGCHARERLKGGHPAGRDVPTDTPCTECHDPHGGENPFFLKRSEQ